MKTFGWVVAVYLAAAGVSQFVTAPSTNMLPDLGGSLIKETGATAGFIDIAAATILWLTFLRS